MLMYGLIAVGIFLLMRRLYFEGLDKDRAQHHLASLLCAVAAGQSDHDSTEIAAHLAAISKNAADRKLRLGHAVRLARASTPPELFGKVQALAREI